MSESAAVKLDVLPIRFSHLRAYGVSAAHGYHSRVSEWKPSATMLLGTAVHAMAFKTGRVISYPKVRRGKEWEEFKWENSNAQILTETEFVKAANMAGALLSCPLACSVMQGETEKTILFDWFGRKCRATPDVKGNGFVTDLKTCESADPAKFVWSSLRFKYHAQMRMQLEGAFEGAAYIVAIESTLPHPVTVFRVTDEALIEGEKLLTLWMERLKTCEESDSYPPYVQTIVPLDVPRDDELDFEGVDDEELAPVPPLEL